MLDEEGLDPESVDVVEVPAERAPEVAGKVNGKRVRGRELRVEVAQRK